MKKSLPWPEQKSRRPQWQKEGTPTFSSNVLKRFAFQGDAPLNGFGWEATSHVKY